MFFYIFPFWFHIWWRNIYSRRRNPIVDLPAFLSRSSECCGRTNLFCSQNRMIRSSLSRSSHKNNVSVTLVSRLMPNSIDSKTLVNTEKGFLYLQYSFPLENESQNGNMKINVHFALCFFAILPWLPVMPLKAWTWWTYFQEHHLQLTYTTVYLTVFARTCP